MIARRGEPGYRDKLTNLMNSMYVRDKSGKLVMSLKAPVFEEARKRIDKSWMKQYHEGSIARVCASLLSGWRGLRGGRGLPPPLPVGETGQAPRGWVGGWGGAGKQHRFQVGRGGESVQGAASQNSWKTFA